MKKYSTDELALISYTFSQELEKASKGKPSSVSFIQNHIHEHSHQNESIQSIVIGGSVFESALLKGHELVDFKKMELPNLHTVDTLLSLLLDYLAPHTTHLGISFAFPLSPVSRGELLDGKLLYATKDHTLEGLVGEVVGETVEKAILDETGRSVSVSVANDTVCLVLSGKEMYKPDELIGGVVGTGVNFGFYTDENTVVNLESGNFHLFCPQDATFELDRKSSNPGKQLFEKEVAGGYLYKHFQKDFPEYAMNSTNDLSTLAYTDDLYGNYAKELFDHSAALVAAQIAGISQFKEGKPLIFVMEGSVFWFGYTYKETIEKYLQILDVKGVSFVKIDKSGLKGTALL